MRLQVAQMQDTRIVVAYCAQCQWLLRAAWLAQELLMTFGHDISEVALRPGSGGIFEIWMGNDLLWSRTREGRFPEAKEIKQRVRDRIDPDRDLGHIDRGHVR